MNPLTVNLSNYMQGVYDDIPQEYLHFFEPKKRSGHGAYHSPKSIASGLYLLIADNAMAKDAGIEVNPMKVMCQAICYEVINHDVPLYYVSEQFARAVADTELPHDLRIEELNFPMPGFVVAFPRTFMNDYLGIDTCFVYACRQPKATGLKCKYFPGAPSIEALQDKVSWMWYKFDHGRISTQCSSYEASNLATAVADDQRYTDWTGATPEQAEAEKKATAMASVLMLKLLCMLNWRDGLITPEAEERPAKTKGGVTRPAVWYPNFIGRDYRLPSNGTGTHASPKLHTRSAHWTYQVIGKREDFIPVASMPRDDKGYIIWDTIDEDTKTKFWKTHRRILIDRVVVGA